MAKSTHKKNNAKKKNYGKKTKVKRHVKKEKVIYTKNERHYSSGDNWQYYDELETVEMYAKEEHEKLGILFGEYVERVFEFHPELKDEFELFGNPEFEEMGNIKIPEHTDEEIAKHFGISVEEYIEKFTDYNLKTEDYADAF